MERRTKNPGIEHTSIPPETTANPRGETPKSPPDDLESLVSLVAHSLKSPLASCEGLLAILEEELADSLTDDQKKYFSGLRRNQNTVSNRIQNFMEFCRAGKSETRFSHFSLQETVLSLIEEINVLPQNKNMHYQIPRPLPKIFADRAGLAAVFENILGNAAKYRRRDQAAVVKIEFHELPRFFAFHIRDNGIGVEDEDRAKLFELFQRGGNVGHIEGTGVGLAICHRIVKKHGGLIVLKSSPGKGAAVSFTLPKAR